MTTIIHRSNVNAWECDENGHLNVRYYIGKNYQGLLHLLAEIGLSRQRLQQRGARPSLVSQHVRYHREARVSVPFIGTGHLVTCRGSRLELYSELIDSINAKVYTTFNSVIEIVDELGHAIDVESTIAAHTNAVPEHGAVRSLEEESKPVLSLERALAAGYVETGRGVVIGPECDALGRLEAFQFAGRIADAIPNFLSTLQSEQEFALRAAGELGGAVIESRADYFCDLLRDQRYVVVSGLRAFSEKIMRLSHLIFDLEFDELAFHSRGIAVALDLKTRKSVPFSADRLARMQARLLTAV